MVKFTDSDSSKDYSQSTVTYFFDTLFWVNNPELFIIGQES
jgi:hypothetical protein